MQFSPMIESYLATLADADTVGINGDGNRCLLANAIKHAHPEYDFVTVDCIGNAYADDDMLERNNEEYEQIVSFFDKIGNNDDPVSKKRLLENATYRAHYSLSKLFETIGQSLPLHTKE